ncbi:glycerol-3-phosphate acyltransferase [Desulfosarcina sp. OttesenSCG-928-A07]|nr:glycerol-3-phosphate acyltransferase [Desulfosarcina sp. OttesenSCG-928-A07]
MKLIFLFVLAYVAGSVNFSILVCRLSGLTDPRENGSNNPGATNVYRQAGPFWAGMVLLLDMARAIIIALLALYGLPVGIVPWIGLGLILGNRFPCFHGFKGGKGVANYLGFSLVLAPEWAGIGAVVWAGLFLLWKTPFIASFGLVACLSAGIITRPDIGASGITATLLITALVVAFHHRNIRELRPHQER